MEAVEAGESEESAGVDGVAQSSSRFWANCARSRADTSSSTPRPNWATRPDTVRSVSIDTRVPSPSGRSSTVTFALAWPCPRVSRPLALMTRRISASSTSRIDATPRYAVVTGPNLTVTVPA